MIEQPDKRAITVSQSVIAKNTLYNLLGYGIPLAFALLLIPPLIHGLGKERFGILSLAWIIIGYFSFFDFGIGKALTKIVSEKIGLNQTNQIPELFWTSLFLMFGVSIILTTILVFLTPSLLNIFNVSLAAQQETKLSFYILALSIPIVTTTAGLRGVLEGYQRFDIINIIRALLGILMFLMPLLILIFINSLFWIIAALVFIRIIIWMFYLKVCFSVNHSLKARLYFNLKAIKPVLKFGIWITIANFIGPLILYSDRFLIGSLISAEAITFYATPYEIVNKLLLIPSALTGVLFPVFTLNYYSNPENAKKIFLKGAKIIFLILYPIVFILITFSFEGMTLWLGEEFAINSFMILQFLSIGILMNSISMIPNNFFQGAGKPKIPTLINLIELPFYILTMWYFIKTYGTKWAAFAYMFMAGIDAAVMYLAAYKNFAIKFESKLNALLFVLLITGLLIPFLINSIAYKIIFTSCFFLFYSIMTWKYFLTVEEKIFIVSKLKFRNTL